MSGSLLRTERICKDFAAVPVLRDISLAFEAGETLGLIGENGAGKSTLMKILSGIYQPSSGAILLDGGAVAFRGPADAKRAGISIVPQEFNLCADLSVSENIYLGEEIRRPGGVLDRAAMRRRTQELLAGLAASIDPDARIADLSAAQKQLVEICKALVHEARVLILDEPTTVLTRIEIEGLFKVMRDLRSRGIALVYISHKLWEIAEICDRVAILRDGELVHAAPTASLDLEEMARRMVGRELSDVFPPRVQPAPDASALLELRGFSSPGAFEDVSFAVHSGEILGLAGLVGAGRTEVAEAVMGLRRSAGQVLVEGKRLHLRGPAEAVAAGIGYLSEDRQGSGVMVPFTIAENTSLVSLPSYSRGPLGYVDRRRIAASTEHWQSLFAIKCRGIDQRLEELSGGNQQKVSLAKSLDPQPKVLIVDEPTRGVDVGAKQEIYRLVAGLAAQGIAILFISSELEEILGMCQRVLVMRSGRMAGFLEGEAINEEEIMYLATGIREGA